jgi:hypothetical protein
MRITLRVGEAVAIGGPATMTIEHRPGQAISLVFDAARSVPINRLGKALGMTGKREHAPDVARQASRQGPASLRDDGRPKG